MPWRPLEPLEPPGTAWKRLETPPHACMKLSNPTDPNTYYGLQYILCLIYGSRVLGTLNWDLRWIMTRALLRDTRSLSDRSVARPQYPFRSKWSSACGHQKVFRLRMLYTKHYFGPKAINFENW